MVRVPEPAAPLAPFVEALPEDAEFEVDRVLGVGNVDAADEKQQVNREPVVVEGVRHVSLPVHAGGIPEGEFVPLARRVFDEFGDQNDE